MTNSPVFGLVLAGGASTRMRADKATLQYHDQTQLDWVYSLVSGVCAATFVSVRPDQRDEPTRAKYPQIVDREPGIGPLAGINAAQLAHPKAAWLVVACDLPFLTEDVLRTLLQQRDSSRLATAYTSAHDGLPEPLCAIWEPASSKLVAAQLASGKQCPRKLLINAPGKLIELPDARALDNVNTPEEAEAAAQMLGPAAANKERLAKGRAQESSSKTFRIEYFAVLREQAGRREEIIDSAAHTASELYEQLQKRHGFKLAPSQLKVAVNAEFCDWHSRLEHGDTVVFIPPVAGG
jgi:molybdopterin-guanine dinucleotide biosynthesis protein A